MEITEQEMTRRLGEADRRIVALRRATLELVATGQRILKQRNETRTDAVDRPERSSRRPAVRSTRT